MVTILLQPSPRLSPLLPFTLNRTRFIKEPIGVTFAPPPQPLQTHNCLCLTLLHLLSQIELETFQAPLLRLFLKHNSVLVRMRG